MQKNHPKWVVFLRVWDEISFLGYMCETKSSFIVYFFFMTN